MMIIHPGCDHIVRQIFPYFDNYNKIRCLDIGSGYGYFGFVCRHYLKPTSEIWGIEIDPIYINRMKRSNIYDHILEGDAKGLTHLFAKNSIDLTITGSVLEHMEKEKGEYILNEIDRITKDLSIIVVPRGDATMMEGHISIWDESDFKRWGYQTKIIKRIRSRMIQRFADFYLWIRKKRIVDHVLAWKFYEEE